MSKKKNEQAITFTGIVTSPSVNELIILDELMRKYQSAKRYLRERIFGGLNRKSAVEKAKPMFLNNSRYMWDAFLEAEASISSQKELLPLYVQQYKTAIQKIEKKIEKIQNSSKPNKQDLILNKKARIKKLTRKLNYYQYHIDNGSIPNLAVTIVHPNGNFRISKVFWMNDVNSVRSEKRNWIIGNTIASVIKWVQSFGIEIIAIEDLYFKNDLSKNTKFNRMSSNFVYRKIIITLISKSIKAGVSIAQVPAYYSSLIGRVKYQKNIRTFDPSKCCIGTGPTCHGL